jgi:hypothetical protein
VGLALTEPGLWFYSQRVDGRPFVNCLPYSVCPVLRWMGYDVPKDYGMQLRQASGVPVAPGRGTSAADIRRALERILPDAPVRFGAVSDAELLVLLPQKKKPARANVVSVIARMERLPAHYRRLVGHTWEGLHGLTLAQRRRAPDGSWLVYLMDPMGRTWRGYEGEWIAQAELIPALHRNSSGLVRVIYGARGSAV